MKAEKRSFWDGVIKTRTTGMLGQIIHPMKIHHVSTPDNIMKARNDHQDNSQNNSQTIQFLMSIYFSCQNSLRDRRKHYLVRVGGIRNYISHCGMYRMVNSMVQYTKRWIPNLKKKILFHSPKFPLSYLYIITIKMKISLKCYNNVFFLHLFTISVFVVFFNLWNFHLDKAFVE